VKYTPRPESRVSVSVPPLVMDKVVQGRRQG
jgi:hypothetical protein